MKMYERMGTNPTWRVGVDLDCVIQTLDISNKFQYEFWLANPELILWKITAIFKLNNVNYTTLIKSIGLGCTIQTHAYIY